MSGCRQIAFARRSLQDWLTTGGFNNRSWGYNIVDNVGDQESDLGDGHSGCKFELPNPFYFIE